MGRKSRKGSMRRTSLGGLGFTNGVVPASKEAGGAALFGSFGGELPSGGSRVSRGGIFGGLLLAAALPELDSMMEYNVSAG